MVRTTLAALIGVLVGVALTAGIVRGTNLVIAWTFDPPMMRIEHTVVYQTMALGGGFGGVCGAIVGLAGAVARLLRDRPPSSGG